jgi:hypothetical protein
MKRIFTIIASVLLATNVFPPQQASAQSPEKMSYQAIIRNSSDQLVTNHAVGMQISILQGSASGTAIYVETQTPTTNANGLVSIEIGGGTIVSGTIATIDWANGTYFIKTETDPTGGSTYTITGASQLLSVPYALHAKTAETVTGTETDPVFNASVAKNITEADMAKWTALIHHIGESYGGGIVFYVDATGQHGLIAATTDQSSGIQWYNGANTTTNAVRDGIGAGMYNTERIIANQGGGAYAAQLCANYQGGGYGDWYQPSKYELNLLYQQKAAVGGFASAWYWSSTESVSNANAAWSQNFTSGNQYQAGKFDPVHIRAIRAF